MAKDNLRATAKSKHLERLLGRLDDLDSVNLTILVQRLARERTLLETVFNTIQEGVIVIDRSGIVEYSNSAANRLIGIKESDVGTAVLWKYVPDLARSLSLHPEGRGHIQQAVSREFEITYPEQRFVRLYMVPFIGPEEKNEESTERFAMILADISEQKASTEELIQNERISSIFELAAGVAHELGNPLNSLNIHLDLIKRRLASREGEQDQKLDHALAICSQEVERLDGIIQHFLKAIRPRPLDLEDIKILEVLTEVLEVQEAELKDLEVQIVLDVKQPPPLILGDSGQIKQVFFNVIKNAMEAMDTGGELHVSMRNDDEYVFIFFADSGVGIAQEDLAKVFQPYYTSKDAGHGLGMLVVQRIVRDHGGQIGIDSRADKGTVVTLQFPLKSRRMRMLESDDS